jgi:hypothetical protein
MYFHTSIQTCIYTYIITYTHAYIHIYILIYIHTYIHTCIKNAYFIFTFKFFFFKYTKASKILLCGKAEANRGCKYRFLRRRVIRILILSSHILDLYLLQGKVAFFVLVQSYSGSGSGSSFEDSSYVVVLVTLEKISLWGVTSSIEISLALKHLPVLVVVVIVLIVVLVVVEVIWVVVVVVVVVEVVVVVI